MLISIFECSQILVAFTTAIVTLLLVSTLRSFSWRFLLLFSCAGALFTMSRRRILLFFFDGINSLMIVFKIIHFNSFLAELIRHLKWLIRTSFLLLCCQFLRFPTALLLHLLLLLLQLISMKMFVFIMMVILLIFIIFTIIILLPVLSFILHISLIK